jgi:hypothetical protein
VRWRICEPHRMSSCGPVWPAAARSPAETLRGAAVLSVLAGAGGRIVAMPIEQAQSDIDANCLLCGHAPGHHDHVPEAGGRICNGPRADGKPCNCTGYVRLPSLPS